MWWLCCCRCECPDHTALPGAAVASLSRLCRAHTAVRGGNVCGFGVGSDSLWSSAPVNIGLNSLGFASLRVVRVGFINAQQRKCCKYIGRF